MIDITKDEFWDSRYENVNTEEMKKSKVREFIIKHKIITALLVALTLLITANTILIYKFFEILLTIQ